MRKNVMFPRSSNCCECKEGSQIGGRIYCSIDLRHHPECDDKGCEWFVLRVRRSDEILDLIKDCEKDS